MSMFNGYDKNSTWKTVFVDYYCAEVVIDKAAGKYFVAKCEDDRFKDNFINEEVLLMLKLAGKRIFITDFDCNVIDKINY